MYVHVNPDGNLTVQDLRGDLGGDQHHLGPGAEGVAGQPAVRIHPGGLQLPAAAHLCRLPPRPLLAALQREGQYLCGDNLLQIQREGQYCVPGVVTICLVTIYYRFNEKVSTVFLVF